MTKFALTLLTAAAALGATGAEAATSGRSVEVGAVVVAGDLIGASTAFPGSATAPAEAAVPHDGWIEALATEAGQGDAYTPEEWVDSVDGSAIAAGSPTASAAAAAVSVVREPGKAALMLAGLLGLMAVRRGRRRQG